MLVDGEEDLRNFCFRINLEFFLDVVCFAYQSHGACGAVSYNVWLG